MPDLIDLSHTIADGLVTYPGLPAPRVSDYLAREDSQGRYAPGTTFHIARIDMVANTGTYLDAPSHRWADGVDLAGLPLERLADLPAVLVDGGNPRGLPAAALDDVEFAGHAVLIRTGWSRHFGGPAYAGEHPFVTREAAERLAQGGAALVGIDSLNIDDTADLSRPAHSILLRAGIPVVEHLTALERLPARDFRFFAVPPRFAGVGTFPVRAFAIL